MNKKTEFTGPNIRVVRLKHDDWCYIVPENCLTDIVSEINDYGGDDELEYTVTFLTMPQTEFDALPEFEG